MKKIISLFLALLMAFSFVTVSFAEETTAPETEATAPAEGSDKTDDALGNLGIDLGEYDWILDLPFWTVGPAFKLAKIAFKLVSAYLKVAKSFGMVDQDMEDMIIGAITDMIKNAESGENVETETTEAPATTAEAAA